ncbi:hypothetical protein M3Y98_00832800 [Aphelenchoides besseyi]|nr:hypothetical protein M3Y98_00832800 [Aphelenchoides besseyi]
MFEELVVEFQSRLIGKSSLQRTIHSRDSQYERDLVPSLWLHQLDHVYYKYNSGGIRMMIRGNWCFFCDQEPIETTPVMKLVERQLIAIIRLNVLPVNFKIENMIFNQPKLYGRYTITARNAEYGMITFVGRIETIIIVYPTMSKHREAQFLNRIRRFGNKFLDE